jgi:hypothetical protein
MGFNNYYQIYDIFLISIDLSKLTPYLLFNKDSIGLIIKKK